MRKKLFKQKEPAYTDNRNGCLEDAYTIGYAGFCCFKGNLMAYKTINEKFWTDPKIQQLKPSERAGREEEK